MTMPAPRDEAGVSLAEVLVAMAILGIAIAGIVSGLGSTSMASDRHRKQVNADTVIRTYAEAIKKHVAVGYYTPCATASPTATPPKSSYDLSAAEWTKPSGYSARVMSVRYVTATGEYAPLGTACTSTSELGAQLLSLESASDDGRDTETLEIVLRRP